MSTLLALLLLLNGSGLVRSSRLQGEAHRSHALSDGMLKVDERMINARNALIGRLAEKKAGLAVVVFREVLDELQDGDQALVDLAYTVSGQSRQACAFDAGAKSFCGSEALKKRVKSGRKHIRCTRAASCTGATLCQEDRARSSRAAHRL